jgi:adenylyltransferase/sulfurtransferase
VLQIAKTSSVKINNLEAIDDYCEVPSVPSISVEEFSKWQAEKVDFQLIDVREPHEYAAENIGGLNLPLSELRELTAQIANDRKVVIHCKSGARSQQAVQLLQEEFGWKDVYSLEGGILAIN